MTTTTGVSGAISGLAAGSNSALNNVNFDTFLKLLVTQLKNQDPLNPLEGTEFTGQIAQFSSLEQQINGNSYLQKLLEQKDYGQQNLAATYIGKEVLVPGDIVAKVGDGDTTFGYSVAAKARSVDVSIVDEDGNTVKSFDGDISEGKHVVVWDGKNEAGEELPEGNYKIFVSATDADGKKVASSAYSYGKVDSVLVDGSDVALSLFDGRQVAMVDVMAVQVSQTDN